MSQGLFLTNGEPIAKMVSVEHSLTVRRASEMTTSEESVRYLFLQILGESLKLKNKFGRSSILG